MTPCPVCGGRFPDIDGPTHRYLLSSPGCWGAYGTVRAHQAADYDAFAAQHPHSPWPQNAAVNRPTLGFVSRLECKDGL